MAITDSTNPQTTSASTTPDIKINLDSVTPEIKNIGDIDLSLDLPKTEPVAITPDTDWLKAEDELTKEAPVSEPTPTPAPISEPTQTTEPIKMIVETPTQIEIAPTEKLPEGEIVLENMPKTGFKNDMQIIKDLQANEISAKPVESATAIIPETTPVATEPEPVETPMITPETPVKTENANTMNLDALLSEPAIATVPVAEVKPMPGFPPMPTETKAVMETAVAQPLAQTTAKNKGVKAVLFVMLFVALGFTTYFIINTMYPMGLFTTNSGSTTIAEVPAITGDILSGEILTEEITGDLIAVTSGTDTMHGSATDANFTDLDSILSSNSGATTPAANNMNIETIVVQLNNYQELGAKYLQIAKQANDVQSMKRALFLTKKTATLLTEIVANANAITTMQTEITDNMNNFATFLQNLKDKYGEVNASTDTTQDISNQMIGQ